MEKSNQAEKLPLTDQQLECLVGFYGTLKNIYSRLMREGYTVVNEEIIPPTNDKNACK